MAGLVVDASTLAAVVFREPSSEALAARLDGTQHLAAPALIWFELANVCWKKTRRHPDDADEFVAQFACADGLGLEIMAVDHVAVVQLARETGLTTYDASYLWLARHLGHELLTLDQDLLSVAQGG